MTRPVTRQRFLRLAGTAALGASFAVAGPGRPRARAHAFRLVTPGDEEYESRRRGFNLRIDRRPAAIAVCTEAAHVQEAVTYAAERGLVAAVRSGGHSFEGFSTNDGGLVIDVSGLDRVHFLDGDTVAVGAGCTLASLHAALLPRQRIVPAGSCGGVGIGGLTLGGGYGFFSRRRGLTCDSLLRATLVDGRGRVVDTTADAELDFACRGGLAAHAAVATEFVFRTHAAPRRMTTHRFKFRRLTVARGLDVAERWARVAAALSRDTFSAFVVNGPFLTVVLKTTANADPTFAAASDELESLADEASKGPPRRLADALRASYGQTNPTYFRCGSGGAYRDFAELAPVLEGVLPVLVETRGLIFHINTLGGAIAEAAGRRPSAYPHRDRPWLTEIQAYWDAPGGGRRLVAGYDRVRAVVTARGPAAHYASYPDLTIPDWRRAYFGASFERLQAVKRRLDPDDRFHHAQSVPATGR